MITALILSGFLLWQQPATLVDGRCSVCAMYGARSTVSVDTIGTCTAIACPQGYYDEDGQWHTPIACNTCTRGAWCSNGHRLHTVPDAPFDLAPHGIPIGWAVPTDAGFALMPAYAEKR
jgi:hypothetical protein